MFCCSLKITFFRVFSRVMRRHQNQKPQMCKTTKLLLQLKKGKRLRSSVLFNICGILLNTSSS
eukprot:UN00897